MPKGEFLYKNVYSGLKEKIENGQFAAGSRLPSEEELCDTYQVSVITVKRAMQMLAKEELVRRVPGKGTFVTEIKQVIPVSEAARNEAVSEQRNDKKLIGVILEYAMPSFGMDLMYELDKAALAAGYRICVRFSYADRERETQEIEFLMSLGIDGLIILPCHGFYYNMAILKLVIEGFPVVVLDKKMEGIQVPSIRTDNADAVFRLVDYLKEQGRSRIGIITVKETGTISLIERRKAFRKKIEQLRLPVMEECILPEVSYTVVKRKPIEDYVVQIGEYLKHCGRNLDGVVCMEYGVLLAFLEAVSRAGEDKFSHILPCSVDEVYLVPGGAKYPHIKQNEASMAKTAVELLTEQIAGKSVEQDEVKIPGIFRE